MKALSVALCGFCTATALAQSALPLEFPADAKPIAAATLKESLAGRTFNVALADGSRWRLEYKANGYFFVNTSSGFNGTGDWRADDERLCTRLRGGQMSCNEVRAVGSLMFLKRDSGEVIALKPQ
jgi:hypothetical protein